MTETHWMDRVRIAEHEATHCVVAQKMGLTVSWITIDPGNDEGIDFGAAVKIPDETLDYSRDLFAICVSMAAPIHIVSHTKWPIGRYARLEYQLATELGGSHGIIADDIYDRSAELVDEHWPEIHDLAMRLNEEGRIVFVTSP